MKTKECPVVDVARDKGNFNATKICTPLIGGMSEL